MRDDAVWAETTDGGLLKQLFGFYPTLHDSAIRSVEIDRARDQIIIVVDYTDLVEKEEARDGQELSARIRLEWSGIHSFVMPLDEHDLLKLEFGRDAANHIVTRFETWPGMFGTVVSDEFEAVLVQVDPGDPGGMPSITYR